MSPAKTRELSKGMDQEESESVMDRQEVPQSPQNHPGKLELVGAQQFEDYDNMYKVVDFLNRNLRKYHLMFGLRKDEEAMTINIYEVE